MWQFFILFRCISIYTIVSVFIFQCREKWNLCFCISINCDILRSLSMWLNIVIYRSHQHHVYISGYTVSSHYSVIILKVSIVIMCSHLCNSTETTNNRLHSYSAYPTRSFLYLPQGHHIEWTKNYEQDTTVGTLNKHCMYTNVCVYNNVSGVVNWALPSNHSVFTRLITCINPMVLIKYN